MGGRTAKSSHDSATTLQNLDYGRGNEYISTILACSCLLAVNILAPRVLYPRQDDYVEQRRSSRLDPARYPLCVLLQVSFTATPPLAIERSAASRIRMTASPCSKPEWGFSLSATTRVNAASSSVRDISLPYSG